MKLGFIGGGTMAEAMIKGVLNKSLSKPKDITVGDPIESRCKELTEVYDVTTTTSNKDVIKYGELIVLAVKPQDIETAAPDIGPLLNDSHTILSIIAGLKLHTLTKKLDHPSIIRVMPNTPAQIGSGMSVWTSSTTVTQNTINFSKKLLGTLGEELYVSEERYLDMATALSASGPAYVFLFIEALVDAGVYMGLPRSTSRKLAIETVLGSAKLVKETGRHPAQLRDMVASPGGTTVEGLTALEEGGLRPTVINAVMAAFQKSIELGSKE
jgi:pyrroline-5-carboxylate reductase